MHGRKLIGAMLLIALLVTWLILGLALAPVAFGSPYGFVPVVFYIVAGLGWLPLAMPLVSWMARRDPQP